MSEIPARQAFAVSATDTTFICSPRCRRVLRLSTACRTGCRPACRPARWRSCTVSRRWSLPAVRRTFWRSQPSSSKPSPWGKVAPQGRMRGCLAAITNLRAIMARFALISQRAGGSLPPSGKPKLLKKVRPPWPLCEGAPPRRRWGRRTVRQSEIFPGYGKGVLSSSAPLRGTAPPLAQAPPPPYRGGCLAEGGFRHAELPRGSLSTRK